MDYSGTLEEMQDAFAADYTKTVAESSEVWTSTMDDYSRSVQGQMETLKGEDWFKDFSIGEADAVAEMM